MLCGWQTLQTGVKGSFYSLFPLCNAPFSKICCTFNCSCCLFFIYTCCLVHLFLLNAQHDWALRQRLPYSLTYSDANSCTSWVSLYTCNAVSAVSFFPLHSVRTHLGRPVCDIANSFRRRIHLWQSLPSIETSPFQEFVPWTVDSVRAWTMRHWEAWKKVYLD